MNQSLITKFFLSFVSFLMLQQVALQTLEPKVTTDSLSVKEIAEQWKLELANQPEFKHWQDAALSIDPLGPGTHGWIAFIEKNNETIGYMIIHSDFDHKYILTEYGIGEPSALQFLKDHTQQWTYFDYFLHIITLDQDGEANYIEPFKLEQFPLTAQMMPPSLTNEDTKKEYSTITTMPTLITGSYMLDYFSPYDRLPWLSSAPFNDKLDNDVSIETWIELESQFYYVVKSWDSSVTSVYSITGFHEWDQYHLFLKLEDEQELISRFIPYDALMSRGQFYTSLED